MPPAPFELDFVRIINAARLELESAGNPAYAVSVIEPNGQAHLAPMVFSTVGPATDHATRLGRAAFDTGEQIVIVSRSAAGRRAMFTVVEPRTLRKLHQRLEVIEETFAELDTTI
ncbi:hypothetical protein DSM104299_02725 [Baekduia alba]|uniref:hypothetical protein n=1 Tax=Baekduia alba TaxID=2997333 RepID=UPI002340AAF2|nr:hypothetical protein [Baekduia alba]WCB93997.1 hypothetical protein DSM104299_02725 [Baekduia alba]